MQVKLIPAGQGFERFAEAAASDYGSLIELVVRALRDKCSTTPTLSGYYPDPSGIWADRIVAKIGGRYLQFPYQVDADNKVSIGEPVEVTLAYNPVREAVREATGAVAFRETADGSLEVTIVRAGESKNGNYYSDASLREATPLFEGVRVFVKSDAEHTKGAGKDVRNLIGGIYGVRFVEGATPDTGALVGTFRAIDPADPTVTKMTEAVKRGLQGLMGLSLDAEAKTAKAKRGQRSVREALKFTKVHSVDLIVEPGAGGSLDRLTEAADPDNNQPQPGADMLKKHMHLALAAISAAAAAQIDPDKATDGQVVTALTEACSTAGLDLSKVMTAATAERAEDVAPAVRRLVEAASSTQVRESAHGTEEPVTRAELAMYQARGYASMAIAASTLPLPAKERLQRDFKARERFTEAEVDAAITGERDYLARFTESGRPTGGMPRIEMGDRRTVIADMLDAFFDPTHKNHNQVRSFKECYIEITGDRYITGEANASRLTESIGTDTFANALGNSITRRMVQVYRDAQQWQAWRSIVNVAPVGDFRTQERTQIGGYGDLPIVAERGGYNALTDPSDVKATYAVAKRGGLAQITMEGIKNDDVGAIQRVPVELGRTAARTLYAFVMNFFASNPLVHDGLALYHATHGNLFTAALDATSFPAHRLAMKKQTGRDTGKRIGLAPRFLLVPDDLEETAVNLFRRNTNNDKTFVQSLTPDILPVPTWTDTNDWVTVADPLDMPVLEIGFLDGQEEPTLLVQDNPTSGSVFTNDVISWKVRHIYGGNVLPDGWKGTTKAVVP
ncbi:MAG: hypothetical protein E6Q67_13020 [Roseateles sp.]|nr:MAG: hypothetical protein E6Q67_13020 [Roseateles sp.]